MSWNVGAVGGGRSGMGSENERSRLPEIEGAIGIRMDDVDSCSNTMS